jgi:low affinity Fe/Cu permease
VRSLVRRTNSFVQWLGRGLELLGYWTAHWTGSSWAFGLVLLLTVGWVVTGPIFHFSDTWQLVMNTISSVVTFLMVFLLQRAQNRDTLAMQVKLNELIAAQKGASNRLISVESLSEDEVHQLYERYLELAHRAQDRGNARGSFSVEQLVGRPDVGPVPGPAEGAEASGVGQTATPHGP